MKSPPPSSRSRTRTPRASQLRSPHAQTRPALRRARRRSVRCGTACVCGKVRAGRAPRATVWARRHAERSLSGGARNRRTRGRARTLWRGWTASRCRLWIGCCEWTRRGERERKNGVHQSLGRRPITLQYLLRHPLPKPPLWRTIPRTPPPSWPTSHPRPADALANVSTCGKSVPKRAAVLHSSTPCGSSPGARQARQTSTESMLPSPTTPARMRNRSARMALRVRTKSSASSTSSGSTQSTCGRTAWVCSASVHYGVSCGASPPS
jgi:hypothetical protein